MVFEQFRTTSPRKGIKEQKEQRRKMEQQHKLEMREHITDTLVKLNAKCKLYEQDIQRDINAARSHRAGTSEQKRVLLRLRPRLAQYWYIKSMVNSLYTISDQMDLMDLSVEFGQAVSEVTDLTRGYSSELPNTAKLLDRYKKLIKPFDFSTGSDLNALAESLMSACRSSVDAETCSDEMIQNIINGTVAWNDLPSDDEIAAGTIASNEALQEEFERLSQLVGGV